MSQFTAFLPRSSKRYSDSFAKCHWAAWRGGARVDKAVSSFTLNDLTQWNKALQIRFDSLSPFLICQGWRICCHPILQDESAFQVEGKENHSIKSKLTELVTYSQEARRCVKDRHLSPISEKSRKFVFIHH